MKTFLLFFSLMIIAGFALASGKHHTYPITIETETIIERYTEKSSGTALAVAYSQLQFDKNISGLQFGIGGGFYDDKEAIAFGLAKQIKEKTILNFSVGSEGKKSSYGIGYNTSW